MTEEEKSLLAELKAKEVEAEKALEVSVKLTPEIEEAISKQVKAIEAKLVEKQKAFKFHGGAKSEAEAAETEEKLKSLHFVNAILEGDRAKAIELGGGAERAKALNISNNGTGGFLVPTIFETDILGKFDSYSEIIADADVQTWNKPGNIFKFNELSTRVNVFYVDENGTGLTSSTPTYTEPSLAIADLLGSTTLTLDFLEDTEVDTMGDLARQYGEGMANKLQARLINGDVTVSGVVTKGIFNVAGTNALRVTATAAGYTGILPSDLEAMYFSAISIDHFQEANKDGKFYMHPQTLAAMRKNVRNNTAVKDYISVFDPIQMTVMGRPIVMTNQAPIPTTTTSNPFVVYGNLKNHLVVRRKRGLTMKVNDSGTAADGRNLNYQNGRELVVSQRIGHQVVLAGGLTTLTT